MNPRPKPGILHLADRRKPTADSAFAFAAPRSRVPAAIAQIAIAAAMTEPTASLGGSSRASRMAVALFQRLFPCFPPASAAANWHSSDNS